MSSIRQFRPPAGQYKPKDLSKYTRYDAPARAEMILETRYLTVYLKSVELEQHREGKEAGDALLRELRAFWLNLKGGQWFRDNPILRMQAEARLGRFVTENIFTAQEYETHQLSDLFQKLIHPSMTRNENNRIYNAVEQYFNDVKDPKCTIDDANKKLVNAIKPIIHTKGSVIAKEIVKGVIIGTALGILIGLAVLSLPVTMTAAVSANIISSFAFVGSVLGGAIAEITRNHKPLVGQGVRNLKDLGKAKHDRFFKQFVTTPAPESKDTASSLPGVSLSSASSA